MLNPRIIEQSEKCYKNLEAVAKLLEATSKNNWKYEVRDIYFDFGQNWLWTTITCPTCQVLNPKEWEQIVTANSVEEFAKIVKDIQSDVYFQDKERHCVK